MKNLHQRLVGRHKWYAKWHKNPNHNKVHWGIVFVLLVVTSIYTFKNINLGQTASCAGTDSWITTGHDGKRTGASGGCITSLRELWTYHPTLSSGIYPKYTGAGSIVATPDSIYYRYGQYNPNRNGSHDYGAIDKISLSGAKVWAQQQDLGYNHDEHTPLALSGNSVYLNDDSFAYVNISTGQTSAVADPYLSLDTWGEILPDPGAGKLYTVNKWHLDYGGIWVGAYNAPTTSGSTVTPIWKNNNLGSYSGLKDEMKGSLALDGSTLFYAPRYKPYGGASLPYPSGLYAFDSATGTKLWNIETTPSTPISAGNGLIYMIENSSSFVARNQTNGSVAWTTPLNGTLIVNQPPVLASGLAIIATSNGVFAYNATNGNLAWSKNITSIPPLDFYTISKEPTVMAAALGSNTLLVTTDNGIYILSLTDGTQLWSGMPPALVGNRPGNPIIVGNRVYVTALYSSMVYMPDRTGYSSYPNLVVALEDPTFSSSPSTDTTPPTTSITAPTSGQTLSGMTTIYANASDNVGVSLVNFYLGTVFLGTDTTSPYSFSLNTTSVANGTYSLTARAYDSAGNSAPSSPVSVTLYNTYPIKSASILAYGGTIVGELLSATVDPMNPTATYQWQSATTSAGTYTNIGTIGINYSQYIMTTNDVGKYIRVIVTGTGAYTGSATSAPVGPVTSTGDNKWPIVSITSPTAGQTFSGNSIPIYADASDNVGVTKVDFFQNDLPLGTDTTSPYSYTWNTTYASNRIYVLTAKAYDAAGNVGTSNSVNISINKTSGTVSSVSISGTPTVGQTLSSTLSPSGATVFYEWQSATTSGGTYSNIPGATSSTYILAATDIGKYIRLVATGSGSYTGTATSSQVGPVTSSTPTSLTSISISGTAKVGQILSTTIAPTGATATYQWQSSTTSGGIFTNISGATFNNYTPITSDAGNYLRVQATGTGSYTGTVTSSQVGPVAPLAGGDTTIPVVSITSPTNGTTFARGSTTTISAIATDNIGVTKVEFYRGTTLIGTDTTVSTGDVYSVIWNIPNAPSKTYTLTARAYDGAGNMTISSGVQVSTGK